MSSDKVSCLLNYYLRSGLEHGVIDVATILLERSPGDVHLKFWKAFGMYITGSVAQVPAASNNAQSQGLSLNDDS